VGWRSVLCRCHGGQHGLSIWWTIHSCIALAGRASGQGG
jgi:hypothetical protein